MIGICIAAREEWDSFIKRLNISNIEEYPYGDICKTTLYNKEVILYRSGTGINRAIDSTKYIIKTYKVNKVIVVGTCAGIDDKYKVLDIVFPNKFIEYEFVVKDKKEIKGIFTMTIDINNEGVNTGIIASSNNIINSWDDYLLLKNCNITVADMETSAIAHICKDNSITFLAIKGISDFPKKDSNIEEQIKNYDTNVPIIMNKIVDDYLELAINNRL